MESDRIIYIAGPITDDPDYPDKFAAVEKYFGQRGCPTLNPAKMFESLAKAGTSYDRIMNLCLSVVAKADALALLPNWRTSKGAVSEVAIYNTFHRVRRIMHMDLYPTGEGWQADCVAVDEI